MTDEERLDEIEQQWRAADGTYGYSVDPNHVRWLLDRVGALTAERQSQWTMLTHLADQADASAELANRSDAQATGLASELGELVETVADMGRRLSAKEAERDERDALRVERDALIVERDEWRDCRAGREGCRCVRLWREGHDLETRS